MGIVRAAHYHSADDGVSWGAGLGHGGQLPPLSTRWSRPWHKPYLKTKLCMDMSHTTEVMATFVRFFAYFLPKSRCPKICCHGNAPYTLCSLRQYDK